jgi:hypothetical protein
MKDIFGTLAEAPGDSFAVGAVFCHPSSGMDGLSADTRSHGQGVPRPS